MGSRGLSSIVFGWVVVSIAGVAGAQLRAFPGAPPPPNMGPNGTVQLPYMASDAAGNQWMFYQAGTLQQQGNMPVYSQGGMLTINGIPAQMRGAMPRYDAATGEVIFDNLMAGQFSVSRHIFVNRDESYVRYIDVFRNAVSRDVQVNAQLQTILNFGVASAQTVQDPKKKQPLGWVAQTQQGMIATEVVAGRGAPVVPTVNWTPNNNVVQFAFAFTVPAGKEAAIMHLHTISPSTEAGTKLATDIKPSSLFLGVPKDLVKKIVNFAPPASALGDLDVLRGDMFDVVELATGDQVKGTLKDEAYTIDTPFGSQRLPATGIVAMVSAGQVRPRQLLVTSDGQVIGGQLRGDVIAFELTGGQTIHIPIAQVRRFGFRQRPSDPSPDAAPTTRPVVVLTTGDRVGVQMPNSPIPVATRYGALQLDPSAVAMIDFQPESAAAHQVTLRDGSVFAGIVTLPALELAPAPPAPEGPPVPFQLASLARLQFVPKAADRDESAAVLKLQNDDVLVGVLTGEVKLATAFDTIVLKAAEIRSINRPEGARGGEVRATLWDQTTVSGQVQDPTITCRLGSGLTVGVPVSLVVEYTQPQPSPPAGVVDQIKALAANLNADDWQQRERTEAALVAFGPAAASVLTDIRPQQPPEAQQRIDHVLELLKAKGDGRKK